MPRSITGTLPRRSRRIAALLTVPAAALSLVLLSGCGAGQISQTDTMRPAVPGVNVDSPHHVASVRNAMIVYNGSNGYAVGGTAPLSLYIVNNTEDRALTLRGVTATMTAGGAPVGTVVLVGGNPAPKTRGSASATPQASGPAGAASSPAESAPASPSESAPASASASASASAAPSEAAGSAALDVPIPPDSLIQLAPRFTSHLAITGLTKALGPGSLVYLTFNIAGDDPFGVQVAFGVPDSPPARIENTATPGE